MNAYLKTAFDRFFPSHVRAARAIAALLAELGEIGQIGLLVEWATVQTESVLEENMRLLRMNTAARLWTSQAIARVEHSALPLAALTVMRVLVSKGDRRGFALCEKAIEMHASETRATVERFCTIAGISEVSAPRAQRYLSSRAYAVARAVSVRIDIAGCPAFSRRVRAELVSICMDQPNPGHRHRAVRLLGQISPRTRYALVNRWRQLEIDPVIIRELSRHAVRRD